jgi:hypothetical protein
MSFSYGNLPTTSDGFLSMKELHSIFRLRAPDVGDIYGSDYESWQVVAVRNLEVQDSTVQRRDLVFDDTIRGGPFGCPIRTVRRTNVMSYGVRDAVVVRYRKRVHKDIRFAGCMFIPYLFTPPKQVRYEEVVFAQC